MKPLALLMLPVLFQSGPLTRSSALSELETLNQSRAAAATAMVWQNGKFIFQRSFGYYDQARQRVTAPGTVFNLASVSKQFTGAAVALLEQRGLLKATDSLSLYFPEFPASLAKIQVRHLLYHTSGLPDYTDSLCMEATQDLNNSHVVEFVRTHPLLEFEPGTQFSYSNTGYALVATLVERVSGNSFSQFLKDNFFEPMGLQKTEVLTKSVVSQLPTRAVSRGPSPTFELLDEDPCNFIYGDGTLGTTQTDYPLWAQGLFQTGIFQGTTLKQIFEPNSLPDGTDTHYAYGWMVGLTPTGELLATHTGGWLGYRSYSLLVPSQKLVIFATATSESLPIFDLADELLAKYVK